MINLSGIYQLAGRSESHPAELALYETGQVVIRYKTTNKFLAESWPDDYRYGDVIPGLPVDLIFQDGSTFVPDDRAFRWPNLTTSNRLAEWLESHWITVATSIFIVPLFLWAMVNYVLPTASHAAVSFLPDSIAESMGEQTLYILDKTHLDPSQLSIQQQEHVSMLWKQITAKLHLAPDQYQLHFRQFSLGANAMALPDGSIIVTDDIVTLMQEDDNALIAVLLHEIGHIEHKHSLKMVAQTTATTLLFAMMFGDIEGAGELVLGAGTGLLQSAFSRDMEREADEFSHQNLPKFNISPTAFADAMALLANSHSTTELNDSENADSSDKNIDIKNSLNHWLQYLSSHPETQERINTARKKGEDNRDPL